MKKEIIKEYRLDGDVLEVPFLLDEQTGRYFGDYPELADEPRYTPNGHRWVEVLMDGCTYADGEDATCGACSHMIKQDERDLIGICNQEETMIKKQNAGGMHNEK